MRVTRDRGHTFLSRCFDSSDAQGGNEFSPSLRMAEASHGGRCAAARFRTLKSANVQVAGKLRQKV